MADFILHNYFRSSTSYRARIALHFKNIPFEYNVVHLLKGDQHNPEYKKLNPIGGVPTLVHQGRVIPDSFAIVEYLDEVHPANALLPKDPYMKARARQVCEIINSSMHPYGNLKLMTYLEKTHQFTQAQKEEWFQHWNGMGLEAVEKNLQEFAGTYSLGSEVSIVDVFLIPHMVTCQRFNMDLSKYPLLMKVFENCQKLEAFKKAHPFRQVDTPPELRID